MRNKEKTTELTVKNKEYAEEVADLRRILDAANDAETYWIQDMCHFYIRDLIGGVAARYCKELQEAASGGDEEAWRDAVEDDVLKLGVEREEAKR